MWSQCARQNAVDRRLGIGIFFQSLLAGVDLEAISSWPAGPSSHELEAQVAQAMVLPSPIIEAWEDLAEFRGV